MILTEQQLLSQPILVPASLPIPIPSLSLSSSAGRSDDTSLPWLDLATPNSSLSSSPSSISSASDSVSTSTASCYDSTCCPPSPHSPLKTLPAITSIPPSSFQPLVVIGAGPHSLALCARLREAHPAALYTDLEHARLSWLRREQNEKDRLKRKTVKGHWTARKLIEPEEVAPVENLSRVVRVLDSTKAAFMGRWDSFFSSLELTHLRSPMIFHPDPSSADALVAYAERTGREDELVPIDGVVGAERSKYQRKKRCVVVHECASSAS